MHTYPRTPSINRYSRSINQSKVSSWKKKPNNNNNNINNIMTINYYTRRRQTLNY